MLRRQRGPNLVKDRKLKRELQWYLHLPGGFLKQSTNKASERRQGCPKLQED